MTSRHVPDADGQLVHELWSRDLRGSHDANLIDLAELMDGIGEPRWACGPTAATTDPTRLTSALDGALRDGTTSDDFLHRRMTALRGSGRDGIRRLLAVVEGSEVTRGGHTRGSSASSSSCSQRRGCRARPRSRSSAVAARG